MQNANDFLAFSIKDFLTSFKLKFDKTDGFVRKFKLGLIFQSNAGQYISFDMTGWHNRALD